MSASSERASLLSNAPSEGSKAPSFMEYAQAVSMYLYIVMGRGWGLFGMALLATELALIVLVAVYWAWLAGCAAMVLCFSSSFCYGTGVAARGKYSKAAPFLLTGLILIAGGVLGSHFFLIYSQTYNSVDMKGPGGDGLSVESFSNSSWNLGSDFVYLSDGEVKKEFVGAASTCLHKLPIVNSCINRYYCVAPIVVQGWNKLTDPVTLWAVTDFGSNCNSPAFLHSTAYKGWSEPYRRGVGVLENKHYADAIHNAVLTNSLKAYPGAPLMTWVQDPYSRRRWAWHMGWTVMIGCVCAYAVLLFTISACSGWSASAYPGYREVLYGPNDRVVVRFKKRVQSQRQEQI